MKASVIIPAHNEGGYIEKTLKSISHPDVEVIVVCNGCTDNTAEVAREFTKNVFVLDEANVSKARNFGASKASASRLVFLDADVAVAPGLIDEIIGSGYTIGTSLVKPNVRKLGYVVSMWIKSHVHQFGFCTGMIFCDKDLFFKVGGFDESISAGEDGKLLRAAKRIGKYGVVRDYVYNNMRRFERLGIVGVCWYWTRHYLFFGDRRKYEAVR